MSPRFACADAVAERHVRADVPRRRARVFAALSLVLAACAACGTAQSPQQAALMGGEPTRAPDPVASSGEPQITPDSTGGPTPDAGRPWDDAVSAACSDAVDARFHEVAQSVDSGGVTSFWVRGRDWRVCDLADAPGAEPTVFGPAEGGRGLDVPQLAISTGPTSGSGAGTLRLVAGGELPWAVEEIRYDLPDGESAVARFVTGAGQPARTFWVMTHAVTAESLGDEPGPVTVSVVGGAAEAFRVPWERIQRSR